MIKWFNRRKLQSPDPGTKFAAPEAITERSMMADTELSGIATTELKGMVDQSGFIGCIGGVACLNALVALVLVIFGIVRFGTRNEGNPGPFVFFGLCLVYFGFVIYGCFKRPRLGRVGGMSLSVLLLPLFPIGTWIGIMGLFAFIKGRVFFGPDRVTHARLEAEFKRRDINQTASRLSRRSS